jgi:hypothetical protein
MWRIADGSGIERRAAAFNVSELTSRPETAAGRSFQVWPLSSA